MATLEFDRQRHVKYFTACLNSLPDAYNKLDTNRMTLVHFAVQALDLLGALPDDYTCFEEDDTKHAILDKHAIIEWIYGLQMPDGGFCGGSFLGPNHHNHSYGHIAMTYTALCTLAALGDDLSRVNRKGVLESVANLQRDDGSFQCIAVGSEHDMRFLYCACVICHLLNDWSSLNKDKAVSYIESCIAYDGGISLLPGQEGHGGSTFCAVAALLLMDCLSDTLDKDGRRQRLIHWCTHRQVGGMQGRPNKAEDTCYSYWIGATLTLLGKNDLLDHEQLQNYVLSCQTKMGGFSKILGAYPDILHAFYSMSYLSLSSKDKFELKKLNCTIGIREDRLSAFDCERSVP